MRAWVSGGYQSVDAGTDQSADAIGQAVMAHPAAAIARGIFGTLTL
jgi:hypothetical protein